MTDLANEFRAWILSLTDELGAAGCAVSVEDDEHLTLTTASQVAHVNFYELDPGSPEVVELNAAPVSSPLDPTFFLHFQLDDLDQAKELFGELRGAILEDEGASTTKILLSCTSGLTTSFFAKKMAEVAATLSLGYEFEAKPIEQALDVAGDYAAVMLAPQVHMRRDEMVSRHPELVVFEIPGQVFGSYDAGSALRMLLEALSQSTLAARLEKADMRIARAIDKSKRVLIIGWECDAKFSNVDYRIYEGGEVSLKGHMRRPNPSHRDVEDARTALRAMRLLPENIDAVGVVVSGSVGDDGVRMAALGAEPFDLKGTLEERWGVPVCVDNAANAAAVGCYAWQEDYDSVLLHRQPTGATVGDQGLVLDGRLVRGAHGNAGDQSALVRYLWGEGALRGRAWTSERMAGIVASYLLCAMASVEPEVIYTAVDLLPEVDLLRTELSKVLPEGRIPPIVPVKNYHELALVGEYVICLDALRRREAD